MTRKFRKSITGILIGAMLMSTASGCGNANPDDYSYGQSIDQIDSGDVYVAGNDKTESDTREESTDIDDPGVPVKEDLVDYSDTENVEFEDFIMEYFRESVTSDTLTYNFTVKDGSNFGIEPPSPATLGDADTSEEVLQEATEETEDWYNRLMAFDGQPMTEEEYFTFITMKADLELDMVANENILFYEPFSPMRGFQANISTNFAEYRFDDKQDVEDYIELMYQLPDYVQSYIDFNNWRAEKGYCMQDAAADDVIEQCNTFTEKGENNFLISEFNSKIDTLDFLTDEEKKEYKDHDKDAVLNGIIPAMDMIASAVESNKGKATITGGLCQYDGGKEYYQNYIIPYYSGSDESADYLIKYMDDKFDSLFNDLYMCYFASPDAYEYTFNNLDTLFEVADSRSATENIDILMNTVMYEYPELDKIPYKADYLSKELESIMESTLAYYMSPAIDDEEHNIIRVNGAHTDGMWVTLAHEGCPGHMYQNAYFQATDPNPVRADAYNMGYQEGWAVYTSYNTLKDYDFPDTEDDAVVADLYKINEQLGYLLYGRVDMGVNYEGWSEEDVASYMEESGFGGDFAAELMNTVVGDPGVYLSYSLSAFLMEDMRTHTEEILGSAFDPVEFHEVILKAGPCQFDELQFKLDEYIASK